MKHWTYNTIFYHVYPLGLCGAPTYNDYTSPANPRLQQLTPWIDHLTSLGVNALYMGPVFESTSHGYDTVDYYHIDRRLGTNETLAQLSADLHQHGIRLILDGVFNHVGRDFWAFRDLRANQKSSSYQDWFSNLRFDQCSPYNDPFNYEGWNGHYNLVKLNLKNPQVKSMLFGAVEMWIREFNIDGLRLDTADCLDFNFMQELAAFCRKLRPDFWLMGEVIHGDYRKWVNSEMLDSVTNYECYKGLYSSHVDQNYFEIAYSLNRQFGAEGIYKNLLLYSFADNHDVNRVASNLTNPSHLYTLYVLLFTMPGIPSMYYGSEWGITGKKENGNDHSLRPKINLTDITSTAPHPNLVNTIRRLAKIRHGSPALQKGNYQQLYVNHQQFAFIRETETEQIIVAVNASEKPITINFKLPMPHANYLDDLLNPQNRFYRQGDHFTIELNPCWARIMKVNSQ
jgi:glycosidase